MNILQKLHNIDYDSLGILILMSELQDGNTDCFNTQKIFVGKHLLVGKCQMLSVSIVLTQLPKSHKKLTGKCVMILIITTLLTLSFRQRSSIDIGGGEKEAAETGLERQLSAPGQLSAHHLL